MPDYIEEADIVFVMERVHQARLNRRFGRWLKNKKIVCLNIPDDFDYMQPELIALLEARVSPHLR